MGGAINHGHGSAPPHPGAAHYGRSIKWVEKLMRAGLPHRKDTPTAWPMFRLSEVDAWLRNRAA